MVDNKTVASFVTDNIKTAHIFKKFGIDFCCGGNITIDEACIKNEVNKNDLITELKDVDTTIDRAYDYNKWELSFLIDHIINVHHTYVYESLPILSQYANKVAKVHGEQHKEVVEVNRLFHEVANELSSHLEKEEQILFPYIKQLEQLKKQGAIANKPPFGTVNNPISMMEQEHEDAGDIFKEIAKLTNNYTPPAGACNTFKALYAKLDEFEQDLHHHIHLENNILHAKAIALEKSI